MKKCAYLLLFIFTIYGCRLSAQELDGWSVYSQRPELEPDHSIDGEDENLILSLSGNGKDYVFGGWVKRFEVPAKKHVKFSVKAVFTQIEQPNRCVLATIIWLNKEGRQMGPKEFPARKESSNPNEFIITQIYDVPKEAVAAEVSLLYRWDGDGKVEFRSVQWTGINRNPQRLVKLATVHHKPKNSSTEENLRQFSELADQAGEMGADIVCLPEGITMVGTGLKYVEAAESIPGPSTQYLAEVAKKHQMYIVAGILERSGEVVYNTAILIDRNGQLAGKYRKVSLPREEIEGGVSPGKSLPIFETDFGKIGIMICWDVAFPEPARMLALQGAEVVLMPIWGGNLTLAKARAIENQIYLVTSTYDKDMVSGVIDLEGKIVKKGDGGSPVVMVEVDLNKQMLWPWLGEYKNRIKQEMPDHSVIKYSN